MFYNAKVSGRNMLRVTLISSLSCLKIRFHYITLGTLKCNLILGYVQVLRNKQNLELRLDALKKIGCEQIFHEEISIGEKRATTVFKNG